MNTARRSPPQKSAIEGRATTGASPVPMANDRRLGLWLGLLGVVAFSGTLPATRVAVAYFDPLFVGLGRALVAAILAAVVLAANGARWPARALWPRLAIVAAGIVVGWPVLSAFAMRLVPASHGAVVSGLLPLATALAGAWLAHERPSRRFWICALLGSGVVIGFALWQGAGVPQVADLLLVAAVAAAAIGYAEGARLARTLGAWQVICWVLVFSAPFLLLPTWYAVDANQLRAAPWTAWAGFVYVGMVAR